MSETKTIEERYEELEDLLRELRDAAQSSAHSYETGNLGASRLHDAEATATKEQILKLFSDLMAERGKMKGVNLDEIFPKEIMGKAAYFECRDVDDVFESVSEPSECVKGAVGNYLTVMGRWQDSLEQPWRYAFTLDEKVEFVVIAYSDIEIAAEDGDEYLEELARVRVHLGLTVEIVED